MCFFMHSIRNENMLKMFTVLYFHLFHLFIDSLSCSFSILFFEFRLVIAFCKMYNSFSVEGLYSFIFLGQVISYLNYTFDSLMNALSDSSNGVVLLVLEVHACIAEDPQHFCRLIELLVRRFQKDRALLERRGALVVRRLCVLLDAERVYREFSSNLEHETDLDFASIMVQALNLILLTSLELADLRALVKQSLVNSSGKDLFISLYSSWCHSPMATISLCLLAQAYNHASSVIQSLGEADINAKFLVQLDKLIRLLETPIFAYIRLQPMLLEPGKHTWLLKTLYCLLMLLPQVNLLIRISYNQSAAFKLLRTRLKTVPLHTLGLDQLKRASSENPYSQILQVTEDGRTSYTVIDFQSKLQQFEQMQHRHRLHSRSQLKSLNASSSTISQLALLGYGVNRDEWHKPDRPCELWEAFGFQVFELLKLK
ncbi:hypothetical protein ZIOFF_000002 [Zingiber officinale]|uniref:Vacuolar protein 14 C-terminal Fig4-binding domain-containing protein n=1 Tax=Zingiber officinale TaxID=94328 RepID=A0A8J5I419_ZINOF|nr:hypothetical protein ZIOFF_000002 [Zingiber officinale]